MLIISHKHFTVVRIEITTSDAGPLPIAPIRRPMSIIQLLHNIRCIQVQNVYINVSDTACGFKTPGVRRLKFCKDVLDTKCPLPQLLPIASPNLCAFVPCLRFMAPRHPPALIILTQSELNPSIWLALSNLNGLVMRSGANNAYL